MIWHNAITCYNYNGVVIRKATTASDSYNDLMSSHVLNRVEPMIWWWITRACESPNLLSSLRLGVIAGLSLGWWWDSSKVLGQTSREFNQQVVGWYEFFLLLVSWPSPSMFRRWIVVVTGFLSHFVGCYRCFLSLYLSWKHINTNVTTTEISQSTMMINKRYRRYRVHMTLAFQLPA